jgi:cytochrome c553
MHAMSRALTIGLSAGLALAPAFAHADAAAAKERAQTVCAGCHGPEGISTSPLYPHIAGQQATYLAKAIRDYRDGKRSDPLMSPMAQGLSDAQVEDLAAYFAGLSRK